MDRKLTLSLKKEVIERAKAYAKQHQTSLSKMIEAYFDALTKEKDLDEEVKTTPLVESLCGVIDLPHDFEYKKERSRLLNMKYK